MRTDLSESLWIHPCTLLRVIPEAKVPKDLSSSQTRFLPNSISVAYSFTASSLHPVYLDGKSDPVLVSFAAALKRRSHPLSPCLVMQQPSVPPALLPTTLAV